MTVQVLHTVVGPGGSPLAGVQVITDLYPSGPGYVNTLDETIIAPLRSKTDGAGLVTLDLVPNADIVPTGTVWRVRDYPSKGIVRTHYIEVPDSGGPYWLGDILTDPPGALTPSALAAHLVDTTPHDPAGFAVLGATAYFGDAIGYTTFSGGAEVELRRVDGEPVELHFRVASAPLQPVSNSSIQSDVTGNMLLDAQGLFVFSSDGGFKVKGAVHPAVAMHTQTSSAGPLGLHAEIGFFDHAPISRPAVTGSRAGNAALASLLTGLDALGLIDDQSTV